MFEKAKKEFYEERFGEYGEYGKDFNIKTGGYAFMLRTTETAKNQTHPFYVTGNSLFITDRIKDAAWCAVNSCYELCSNLPYMAWGALKCCWPILLGVGLIKGLPLLSTINMPDFSASQNNQSHSFVIMQNEDGENVLHLSDGKEVISMKDGYLEVESNCGQLHTTPGVTYYSDGEVPQKEEYDKVCECVEEAYKKETQHESAETQNEEAQTNDVVEMNQ